MSDIISQSNLEGYTMQQVSFSVLNERSSVAAIARVKELEEARAKLQSAIEDADADHRNASSYREEMDCYHASLDARDALEAWDSSEDASELASLRAILKDIKSAGL